MSRVGKRFVKSPETADETFGILCDRFGEITALWRNSTDNRNRTFCSVEVLHHAGSLIKGGKLGSKISRETFLCRHFFQTAG